jgi:hypothetical protein
MSAKKRAVYTTARVAAKNGKVSFLYILINLKVTDHIRIIYDLYLTHRPISLMLFLVKVSPCLIN